MAILLLAEHTNSALQAATGKAVAAAKQLGGDIHVLVAGHNAKPAAEAGKETAKTGAAIAGLCGRLTLAEIVAELAARYDAPVEVVAADVAEYLGRLGDRGLMVWEEAAS